MSTERPYTTGDVAKILHVSTRSVCLWIDRGLLKGYRLPGSRDRRVPVACLDEFIDRHGLLGENGKRRRSTHILGLGLAPALADPLAQHLFELTGYQFSQISCPFEAGYRIVEIRPACLILDYAIGRIDASQIAICTRQKPACEEMLLVALTNDDKVPEHLGINLVIDKSDSALDIAQIIQPFLPPYSIER